MSGPGRLIVAALVWSAWAQAQSPPAQAPPPRAKPAAPPAQTPVPRAGDPDEDLLEFLGSDDVGDAAWWDFLKRHPRAVNAAPPPDGKQ